MRCFWTGLFAGWLAVATAAPLAAADASLWELRPYRVAILLAPDRSAEWSAARLVALEHELEVTAHELIGAAWQADVSMAPPGFAPDFSGSGVASSTPDVRDLAFAASAITPSQVADWAAVAKAWNTAAAGDPKTAAGLWSAAWKQLAGEDALTRFEAAAATGLDPVQARQATAAWNRLLADPSLFAGSGDAAAKGIQALVDEAGIARIPGLKKLLEIPPPERSLAATWRIHRGLLAAAFPGLLAEAPLYDKVIVLALESDAGGQRIRAREWDAMLNRFGPIATRPVLGPQTLARTAFTAAFDAFTPLALVDRIEGEKVVIRPRAMGLPLRDPRLVTFRNQAAARLARPAKSGGSPAAAVELEATFLQVEESGAAQSICRVVSSAVDPLAALRDNPRAWLACEVSASPAAAELVLTSTDDPPRPLAGYEVRTKEKGNTWKSLGRTDAGGRLALPRQLAPLSILSIEGESGAVARAPVLTGWRPVVEVRLPVETARIKAEKALAALEARLIEAIARHEIAAARIESRVKAGQTDEAEALSKEVSDASDKFREELKRELVRERKALEGGPAELSGPVGTELDRLTALVDARLKPKPAEPVATTAAGGGTGPAMPAAPDLPAGWQEYTFTGTDVKARLPAGAIEESKSLDGGSGLATLRGFVSAPGAPQATYGVFFHDVFGEGPLPDNALQNATIMMGSRFPLATLKQGPGRFLEIPTLDIEGACEGRVFKLRALAAGRRVYQIIVIADQAQFDLPEVKQFFESLRPIAWQPTPAAPAEMPKGEGTVQ